MKRLLAALFLTAVAAIAFVAGYLAAALDGLAGQLEEAEAQR